MAVAEIGRVVRTYRERRRFGQSEVAGTAGISVSMLSQIEHGKVSPSLDTLLRVCMAVGLEPVDLFRLALPSRPFRIHRQGKRLSTGGDGINYEQLVASPDAGYPAEMFLLEVEAGKKVGLGGRGHEGVELGYVLDGHGILEVGGETHRIEHGDSVSFSAHLPHSLRNSGGHVFRAIWTVIPPHKDYLRMEETTSQSK